MAERDGGFLRDSRGRPILKNVPADAPPAITDVLMAGTLVDADGREIVTIEGVPGTAELDALNTLKSGSPFQANYAYPQGAMVKHQGKLYEAKVAFTSGPTFSAADWTLITAPGGRGVVAQGGQIRATGRTTRAPAWNPGTIVGNPRLRTMSDVLFAPVVNDELDVIEQGGRLHTNFLTYATQPKAPLTTGPHPAGKAMGVLAAINDGVIFHLDGVVPLDEWTIEVPILSVGADLTAQASGNQPILTFKSAGPSGAIEGDQLRLWRSATGVIEARILGVGAATVCQAQFTVVAGEIPADTWRVISVTFKKSQTFPLRVYLGNNVRSSASGAGSVETSPGATAHMRYPLSGFGVTNEGLALGAFLDSFNVSTLLRIGMPTIRRTQRTPGVHLTVKGPTIAVDPNVTAGTLADTGGMLWQYQGWTPNGSDSATSVRNQLATLHGAAGMKRARIEHIIDKAIITGTAANWTANWTPLWEIMDPLRDAGVTQFDMTLGYTPTILGATQATVPSDFAAFALMCKAFMQAAETRYGPAALGSWSLWNEPDLTSFWAGTSTQLVDLWAAVHDQLAALYPGVSIGPTENSGWAAPAITKAIIDRAATDGRRLDHIRIHDYSGDVGYLRRAIADAQAYVGGKANNGNFTNGAGAKPVAVTEWNWSLQDYGQYETATTAFSSLREPPSRTEKLAGYVYAAIVEMIGSGSPFSSFTRAGITTAGSPNGAEAHLGAFSLDDPPRPFPVWAAFQALWKLNGLTRITATVNGWPWLRSLAGKAADGRIVMTYGTWKPGQPDERLPVYFEWSNLPATFTWKHWQIDRTNYRDGRLVLVASGSQTDLPIGTEIGAMGVGCIEVSP